MGKEKGGKGKKEKGRGQRKGKGKEDIGYNKLGKEGLIYEVRIGVQKEGNTRMGESKKKERE